MRFKAGASGPAGSWTWSWTGAEVRLDPSTAAAAAYAPIGHSWPLFRSSKAA
jgi:hypothetical protein